jgi:hypothetical protein
MGQLGKRQNLLKQEVVLHRLLAVRYGITVHQIHFVLIELAVQIIGLVVHEYGTH